MASDFAPLGDVIPVPDHLAACSDAPQDRAWWARLPERVRALRQQWGLTLGAPMSDDATCSWVAPCVGPDGAPCVFKLGLPHMEAAHEAEGLRFWAGDPCVQLQRWDPDSGAMLLERCSPGTALRALPEPEQDAALAGLLHALWRPPPGPDAVFRPLSEMILSWTHNARTDGRTWPDPKLAKDGLDVLEALATEAPPQSPVMLATDLHAGNVLRAERAPWLVIDPKPFWGDRTYDATQHLLNCKPRLHDAPAETIARFADLLGVDRARVRRWLFGRLAAFGDAEGRDQALARRVLRAPELTALAHTQALDWNGVVAPTRWICAVYGQIRA